MLDTYDAYDNHWLKLTFRVKEKWGWPYVRSTWATRMSLTQLSKSFNAFLKDYIRSDFNLNEFFMHFERVLCEKWYKELETSYALCQRLPRVKGPFILLSQMGNVYTKNIFEEFQNEYFLSVESDIQAIKYGNGCSLYTIVDASGKNARKVKMEMHGSLACSCTKFERKGILCSHYLKGLDGHKESKTKGERERPSIFTADLDLPPSVSPDGVAVHHSSKGREKL
ncbi:hypothetical protein ACSBR1_002776 [Camellia fascicularis]